MLQPPCCDHHVRPPCELPRCLTLRKMDTARIRTPSRSPPALTLSLCATRSAARSSGVIAAARTVASRCRVFCEMKAGGGGAMSACRGGAHRREGGRKGSDGSGDAGWKQRAVGRRSCRMVTQETNRTDVLSMGAEWTERATATAVSGIGGGLPAAQKANVQRQADRDNCYGWASLCVQRGNPRTSFLLPHCPSSGRDGGIINVVPCQVP